MLLKILWGLLEFQVQGINEVDDDDFSLRLLWALPKYRVHDKQYNPHEPIHNTSWEHSKKMKLLKATWRNLLGRLTKFATRLGTKLNLSPSYPWMRSRANLHHCLGYEHQWGSIYD